MIRFHFIDTSHVKPRVIVSDDPPAEFYDWGPDRIITESPPCNGHSRPMPLDLEKRPDGSWGLPE